MMQEKNIVRLGLTIIMFIALLGLVSTPALAKGKGRHVQRSCSKTASSAFIACQYEVKDDYWIAQGNCYNLEDPADRAECFADAKEEYKEAKEECREQLEARKDLCDELGEDPYDPQLDPEDFVEDPTTITASNANRYFPLVPGYVWVYEGETEEGTETITVTVENYTKEIEYPAESGNTFVCAVVHDVVELDGDVIEDTFDWYAQDKDGNVWYFGEISLELEDGELVSIDGSWKSGVEGAKPGIIMYASPDPENENQQNPYRQEFFLGDAEDVGEVKELLDDPVDVPDIGTFPSGVIIEDSTPLEPDVSEDKYFAEGLGLYKEINNETDEEVLLKSTNVPVPAP
jgi:hypothetical protein